MHESERRTVSMEARINWTFSPKLSFQLFAQPLLSSGDYGTYKQLTAARTYDFDRFEEGTFTSVDYLLRVAAAPGRAGLCR